MHLFLVGGGGLGAVPCPSLLCLHRWSCLAAQSVFLCVSMSVLPVAGEEALLAGDVDASPGSVTGCSVLDEP